MINKGGYVIINKALDNVYELAKNALTMGKPILWYESDTECYYVDTITLSGTNIVLTKGGKTITIASDNTITEEGNIQPSGESEQHLYQHNISIDIGSYDYINFSIINNDNTEFESDNIIDTLEDMYGFEYPFSAVGKFTSSGTSHSIAYADLTNSPFGKVIEVMGPSLTGTNYGESDFVSLTDNVIQIL